MHDRITATVDVLARRIAEAVPAVGPLPSTPPMWAPHSLSRGLPGIALLFGCLGRDDPAHRNTAHAYLAAVADALPHQTEPWGLDRAIPALAFAATSVSGTTGAYRNLIAALDERVADSVRLTLAAERGRMDAGVPAPTPPRFDTLAGLAGIGRYLLGSRSAAAADTLPLVLTYLVDLAQPVRTPHGTVPGWWTVPEHAAVGAATDPREAVLDLGLAHGVAGPLALLSLARRHGVHVPGQDEAAHRMAEWLMNWTKSDEGLTHWPRMVTLTQERDRTRPAPRNPRMASWCYGTPGIARSLQLAGHAFGVERWSGAATAAVRRLLTAPRSAWTLDDHGLCHGYAGLLQTVRRVASDSPDPRLLLLTDSLADDIARACRTETVYGYEAMDPQDGRAVLVGLPGLLEGTAGIALALWSRRRRQSSSASTASGL
ncbi:lanthionine synthetase C family protein, partial [Streptomyces spectabilis]|uniref:lanthionine synthetase C family protein n=1 Tax=Streptomyces spectabilis TaxID=68270 RepID=UPI0033FAD014